VDTPPIIRDIRSYYDRKRVLMLVYIGEERSVVVTEIGKQTNRNDENIKIIN
jgi:hypothetical protein